MRLPPEAPCGRLPPRGATPAVRQSRFRGVDLAFSAATLAIALPAHAQLFKDDEARKAVIDLRARVTQVE